MAKDKMGYAMKKGTPKAPKGAGMMKNHGNTKKIMADNQGHDVGRVKMMPMKNKGYDDMAYAYKY